MYNIIPLQGADTIRRFNVDTSIIKIETGNKIYTVYCKKYAFIFFYKITLTKLTMRTGGSTYTW